MRLGLAALVLCSSGAAPPVRGALAPPGAQPPSKGERTFAVTARRYAFTPNRIEVDEGDLVRIELRTTDIAHSLTIDDYRIAKRVDAGQPVVLEFRAQRAGTFPFYCNLQIDEGCRRMRGELVVHPRR
jgi:heme/copper-type cytochrome/quinol oxidase subunit 2